ncbi:MAG: hypothetical protein Q8P77_01960 [Candidatus Veblenbacteria bacterium]|nr:hypothetical protein [Candidatus Veblenbacteria bacterium]
MHKSSTSSELGVSNNNLPNIFSSFSEVDIRELTNKPLYFSESTKTIPLSQLDPDSTFLASDYYSPDTILERQENEEKELFFSLPNEEIDGPWGEINEPQNTEVNIRILRSKKVFKSIKKPTENSRATVELFGGELRNLDELFQRDAERPGTMNVVIDEELFPSFNKLVVGIIDKLDNLPKFLGMKLSRYAIIK